MEALPACAIKLAGTEADSCVTLAKVVTRSVLPNRTTELPPLPLTKFVPVTVKANDGLPATAEVCERVASVGTGFVNVKRSAGTAEEAPRGVVRVTSTTPAARLGLVAITCVLEAT